MQDIKGSAVPIWILGYFLALAIGLGSIFNSPIPGTKSFQVEDWVYTMWFVGLFSIAMFMSIILPQRVWRWGVVVGLGLPSAGIIRTTIDGVLESQSYIFPIFALFVLSFIGMISSFSGAASGFLLKRVLENFGRGDK